MKYSLSIFTTLSLLFFLSCDSSSDDIDIIEEPLPVEALDALTLLDVSYGDQEQQIYDIYLPEGRTRKSTKTIILIHGGSWVAGDKVSMDSYRIK